MKALFATLAICLLTLPAFAEIRTEHALIVKAVTNHMFPVAVFELTAEIPCYAQDAKIVKSGNDQMLELSVDYTYDYQPGYFYCQSLIQTKFRTGYSAEFFPQVKLINAAPGVVLEHGIL